MPIDMQHQQMGYDRTATMFTPEGHLLQVEYAEKAVRLGSTSIGMVCEDGVFIIADKRVKDTLIVSESAQKIYEVDSHIMVSVAGIVSDARVLIDTAQVIAQQSRITYDSEVEPELIIKEISNKKQQFTQYGGARPFGVSLLVAGVSEGKSKLYTTEITGNYFEYFANAIGENDQKIKEELRKEYKKDLTISRGIKIVMAILKKVQGEKFNVENFELGYIQNSEQILKRLEGKNILELK